MSIARTLSTAPKTATMASAATSERFILFSLLPLADRLALVFTCTRKNAMSIFSRDGNGDQCHNQARENGFHDRLIRSVFNPSMIRPAILFYSLLLAAAPLRAQLGSFGTSPTPAPTPVPDTGLSSPAPGGSQPPITTTTIKRRGFLGRVMHPFSSSEVLPKYQNPKLRGLILSLQVAPQPLRLSEVRQMEVRVL